MGTSVVLLSSEEGCSVSWVDESVGSVRGAEFELVGAVAPGPDVLLAASESLFGFSAEMEREEGKLWQQK